MKRIYRKVFNSKEPTLGSIRGRETTTSSPTIIRSTTDLLPSFLASDATASAQVTAGVNASVLASPIASSSINLLLFSQTAHNLVSTSASALETTDLPHVSVLAAGVNHILIITFAFPSIRLPMTSPRFLLRFPLWQSMILLL